MFSGRAVTRTTPRRRVERARRFSNAEAAPERQERRTDNGTRRSARQFKHTRSDWPSASSRRVPIGRVVQVAARRWAGPCLAGSQCTRQPELCSQFTSGPGGAHSSEQRCSCCYSSVLLVAGQGCLEVVPSPLCLV